MNQTGRHSKKRKRKMVKKSRYYRERQLRILYIGIAVVLAVLVLAMGAFLKKRYVQPEESESEHEE